MNVVKRNGFYYLFDEYMNSISIPCIGIFSFDNKDRWIIKQRDNLYFLMDNRGNRISDYYEYISSVNDGYYIVIRNGNKLVLKDYYCYKVRGRK